jgi:hypothetical protein
MRSPIDAGREAGWLDIGSYARRGPGRRDRLSPAQTEFVSRTVNRTPEVMVKMLNKGGAGLRSLGRHIDYLDRNGQLEVHTDEGEHLKGKDASEALIDDWDLVVDDTRGAADLKPRSTGKAPKLFYKVLFSMPAGTPSKRVLEAVKGFAREEFGAKHRYAMVLHTDEPHPHVHMVVKAMGEDGRRLNIRRDTLRHWRREFARHLRQQGVAANATDRAVRGESKLRKKDEIYRAALRGDSRHHRNRAELVRRELASGDSQTDPGRASLLQTRKKVVGGWREIADALMEQNESPLALAVRRFVDAWSPVRTERDQIRDSLVQSSKVKELPGLHR